MGGWQHNFFQGLPNIDDINNSMDQLEQDVSSLMNRSYDFGENETPFSFNGNKVYVYKFNPDQTLTLPSAGYITILNNPVQEVISVNILGDVNNWEPGVEWFQFPMIKRGGGQEVTFGISPSGYMIIKNYVVTGSIKVKGYIVYTRN